jgi:hypothetical protein
MKSLYATLICLFINIGLYAQLFIDNSISVEQMIIDFFDNSCVTPSNITFSGAPISVSYFEGANTSLGVSAGILISSGDSEEISNNVSFQESAVLGAPGDSDLESLVFGGGLASFDAAVIEFDILVEGDGGELAFDYVFGSEEYPEYVCTQFNDVFGFFVSGPGINGPFGNNAVNISMIPDTDFPVAINFVNNGVGANGSIDNCLPPAGSLDYSQYYVDNLGAGEPNIAFDGMTTVLPASFETIASETYHVKIGITDIADGIFSSGVFISTTSLCGEEQIQPRGEVAFQLEGNQVSVQNNVRYGTSWSWNYGNTYYTTDRHPEPYTFTEPGQHTVTLITQNYCCSDTFSFNVNIEITDIEEIGQKDLQIFPNHVKDQLNILYPGSFQYQLLDTSGKQILTGQGHQNLQIAVPDLKAGLYFIQIQTEEGSYTQKVQIQ